MPESMSTAEAQARALANYDAKRTNSKVRLTPHYSDVLDEVIRLRKRLNGGDEEPRASVVSELLDREHERLKRAAAAKRAKLR